MDNIKDRTWMYKRKEREFPTDAYFEGVKKFISYAQDQPDYLDETKIRCPCVKCENLFYLEPGQVEVHLLRFGFKPQYHQWVNQGELDSAGIIYCEQPDVDAPPVPSFAPIPVHEPVDNLRQMIHDFPVPSVAPIPVHELVDNLREMIHDFVGLEYDNISEQVQEEPNEQAKVFYDLLRSLDEALYPGCEQSVLSMIARLMKFKSDNAVSERGYETLLQLFRDVLPVDHKLVSNFYETKKMMSGLGLPVQKIHCCPLGCMLYWKEDINLDKCKVCGHVRYKDDLAGASFSRTGRRRGASSTNRPETSKQNKRVPCKKMFYFPLAPRLVRLYYSRATASDMTWHHEHVCAEDTMCHPCDSEAWSHFNSMNEEFATEPRNVRLGLCTDGFNPFGNSGQQYSCWPVILTPYNLPPWLCNKKPVLFLTVLVPGPKNPKMHLDVYLQPLIDELNELWLNGVPAWDVSRQQNFTLRAGLLWTISDFPAYSMLSGWSTSCKKGCPCCMDDTEAFYLTHGKKICWFDCHRKFLPLNHAYRKNKQKFIKNRVERSGPPHILSGEEILANIESLGLLKVTEAGSYETNKQIVRETNCGWRKKSIFWDLPYWKTNLIRHNLDVMHIEKNVFDNLFHTVMNVDGKTKDNKQAREDCADICHRPDLLKDPVSGKYPKACYTLEKEERKILCNWVKELKFPDGYVSKLARCIDESKYRLFGMKSHDCHVFMQRLLPIAFRELLPKHVWESVTQISKFFSSLCCNVLKVSDMTKLEEVIPVILCKLEMLFPPAFFDSMEHLPVHLAYEARIAGPVHYRWMYVFERFMGTLKKMVKNKARVEGSICNAYLVEETSNFCSFYFEADENTTSTNLGDPPESENVGEGLDIFSTVGRLHGLVRKVRWLTDKERQAAHTYILMSIPELTPWLDQFRQELRFTIPGASEAQIEARVTSDFAKWFEANRDHVLNPLLRDLVLGPSIKVRSFTMYYINGFKFHTASRGTSHALQNSYISVTGGDFEYFGQIIEILEVVYYGSNTRKVVLFNCNWFDPTIGVGTNIDRASGIVEVNTSRKLNRYEPFCLASQAVQVYLARYPSMRKAREHWAAVCRVKPRGVYELPGHQVQRTIDNDAYQEDRCDQLTLEMSNDEGVPEYLAHPTKAQIHLADDISEEDFDIDLVSDESDFVGLSDDSDCNDI